MQNSTKKPAAGGRNTNRHTQEKVSAIPSKWSLLTLMTTWFLSDAGEPLVVDHTVPGGATHDQWRELVRRTGVKISISQLNANWGQIARRDFLNWCEEHLPPERRPKLFESRIDAEMWRDEQKNSDNFEKSKKIENFEGAVNRHEAAPEVA
jgi:hypothetical protein